MKNPRLLLRCYTCLAMIACGALGLGVAVAAPSTAAGAPAPGVYQACTLPGGLAWRLDEQGGAWTVWTRNNDKAPWAKTPGPAERALSAEALATANHGSGIRVEWALPWSGALIVKPVAGWYAPYRRPGETFTPVMVVEADGVNILLCRR